MDMEILSSKGGVACDKEGYEYIRIENMNIYRVPKKKCLIAKLDVLGPTKASWAIGL